ncbi:MAG: formate dehydrogenase accessory protein FdhE [Candidatus Acidiferrales bacterium]
MKGSKWDARIRRADDLASSHVFASEGLRFYRRVVEVQESLYAEIQAACGTQKKMRAPGTLRHEFDSFLLLPLFPVFLSSIEKDAPVLLSEAASRLRAANATRWQEILADFWQDSTDSPSHLEPAETLLSWTFLQPYAEYLADHTQHDPIHATPSRCPLCSSKPQVGALRPEGDGAKRSLICALCANEWAYRRIVCPACGEEDVHKLAVYTAQDFGHVRVEACDTCRAYIKTVDLTKNGHALPVVDELATIPLNLWAVEHGYTKLQANLLGI